MITLIDIDFILEVCEQELQDLRDFLNSHNSIEETGENGLLEFFSNRPNLILLIASWHFNMSPACYKAEVCLFNNEFRADFVVADRLRKKYVFIEFENAKEDSIFKKKPRNSEVSNISYEWSPRYEHGVSQVIDWYYRMDDYERTNKFEEYFGDRHIEYTGLLIIGRNHFLQQAGLIQRFRWRSHKTIINSKSLHCITFDNLLEELQEKLEILKIFNQLK
ncbi:MAG: Shedu immune nuclease family protein [Snowella sp.]|nr:Shedu immune nuclease family protein [Snowella sp.]